ncbi:DNA internalization-related competence protein ComEC/Rec2 [Enterococcus wangshanyuanii]|uniref:DNA internalization-related competence protein ComEC/Rec2 n=3 Tax=Enterococcus wangshanyuanii TaxID=2005703 RepID=A0ABQ1NTC5_9ENTE|nr:DNA internalization-related competence protein ComEC/Rec2 [Enterococcus wangshanyuanii]
MILPCSWVRNDEKQLRFAEETELSGIFTVLPDKMNIDGDRLQLEGQFHSKKMARKIVAFYQFSSKQEKERWMKYTQPLKMRITAIIQTPIAQTNLHGFDYQKYLKTKGIYQTLTINSLQSVSEQKIQWNDFRTWISSTRKKAIDYCSETFMKETALHLKTLLFGYRSSDFSQKEDVLANLGILHLFSLSGMHVTFFIGSFRYLFLRIGLTVEKLFWLQLFFALIYAGLTGFSVSVVRALIQSSIVLADQRFRWKLSGLDCWSLTLMAGLIFRPYLLFTIGGQLSYGLSFLILFVQPIVEQINHNWLKSYCFSFLLNIAIIPLLGHSFFEWQLTGSVFTFVLLPIFEYGILPVLTISFISSFLIRFDFWIFGLEYYFLLQQKVFEWLSHTSTFTIITGHFSLWLLMAIIFSVGILLDRLLIEKKKACLSGVMLLLLLQSKYISPKGMVAFIDVGQGDSIFVQTPFHQENILIDTGGKMLFEKEKWAIKSKQKSNADYSVIPFLKSKGVKYLDKVLISHGDLDHCGDLLEIHKKIPIRALYYPTGTESKRLFQNMLNTLKRAGVKCYPILAGQKIGSSISLNVLAPMTKGNGENQDSLVVYSKIADRRFLFTGDLEKEGERQLLTNYPNLKIDVLKVGHHGSKTSTDDTFIKQTSPIEAIISCGRNNRFKHPHDETKETLQKKNVTILQTDQEGMAYYEWTPWSKMSPV